MSETCGNCGGPLPSDEKWPSDSSPRHSDLRECYYTLSEQNRHLRISNETLREDAFKLACSRLKRSNDGGPFGPDVRDDDETYRIAQRIVGEVKTQAALKAETAPANSAAPETCCCCVDEVRCGDDCKGCPVHGPVCNACGGKPEVTKRWGISHVCRECFWKVVHDLRSHEPQRQVEQWHRAMGIYVAEKPSIPPPEIVKTRILLARGETDELIKWLEAGDIEEVGDAIADRLFENYGTAVSCGLNAKALFDEVVRSNFTKDPPGPDGKARKGKNYSPPNLKPIIEAQLREGEVERREGGAAE